MILTFFTVIFKNVQHNTVQKQIRNKNSKIFLTLDHEKTSKLYILTEIFHFFEEILTTIVLSLQQCRQVKLELNNYL
jgi:hypothetical protein